MSEVPLKITGVSRRFYQGGTTLEILRAIDLQVGKGEIIGLVGPSGSGKSTLLHTAGLLEKPDEGDVIIEGKSVGKANDKERTRLRRHKLGFVYQFHHLMPEFTAVENVMLPQQIAGAGKRAARKRAEELLDHLGLSERLSHSPAQLSGGEQQRVAIARALANRPTLLLADEPTGNLDPGTADKVFQELMSISQVTGQAAIIATHNAELARRMDRVIRLDGGRLISGDETGGGEN